MDNNNALLHKKISSVKDADFREFIDDLAQLMNVSEYENHQIIFFLQSCFFDGFDQKFRPIKKDSVMAEKFLRERVVKIDNTNIQQLIKELVCLNQNAGCDSHLELHLHQELRVALNQLMKPIEKRMRITKKKNIRGKKYFGLYERIRI